MDLSKVFPGSRGLRVDQAPYKGAGFMGTPESAAALFKNWRILPNQIRDIVLATSDMHPTLDDISRKAAGDAYASRWDPLRTAWMRDTIQTPATDAPAQTAGSTGGLNLSALRSEQAAPELDEDAAVRAFMEQVDAQFATAPDPEATPDGPAPAGLNLSALRDTDNDDGGPAWLTDAIAAIKTAGPTGMKPSAVADLVRRSRQAVRAVLKAAAERGELVYRDNGPHSVYVHPDHA
ncbi:hypothetical protein ACWGF2_03350, partial [Streptomyces sp. NPDC054919]